MERFSSTSAALHRAAPAGDGGRAGDVHNTISGIPGIGGPVIQAAEIGSINFGTERRRTLFSGFTPCVRPVSGPC
ncbi:hypothetical protein ABT126_18795 [Streptomyces sp. NPDC002012]|uniref:hypothetical protein n=1 Tax=Streptomyces sp. NPDC002012 TaxID=3154532 RepID=UPI003324BC95